MRRRAWRTAAGVSLGIALAAAPPLGAQRALPAGGALPAGTRVRVEVPGTRGWYVGQLLSGTPDSLRLLDCPGCTPLVFPRDSIRRFEWSSGQGPDLVSLTTLAGAFAGAAIAWRVTLRNDHCRSGEYCVLGDGLLAALLGGVTGGEIGAEVGRAIRRERWHPATPSRVADTP